MSTPTHDSDHHEIVGHTPDGTPIMHGPDGLSELDNPMPRWMTLVYIGTIVWSLGYLVLMPGVGINLANWGQYKSYSAEMADAKTRYAEAQPAAGGEGDLAAKLAKDPAAIAAGKELFSANCAACHGAEAKGAIGPDLTDATWLYGGEPGQIAHTIGEGTSKGMPPFKGAFSAQQVAELTAFVHSLGQ